MRDRKDDEEAAAAATSTTTDDRHEDDEGPPSPTTIGALLGEDGRNRAISFLKKAVCTSTAANYAPQWKLWEDFHRRNGSNDLYLTSLVDNDNAKAIVWTLFIVFLHADLEKRGEQVYKVLSGVRYHLLHNLCGVTFLNHDSVKNARRACRRTPDEERRHALQQRLQALMPVSIDMLDNLREVLWSENDWEFDALLKKAIWLACCLSFDRGPRLGNVSLKNGKNALDHNIRCNFVTFSVTTSTNTIVKVSAGPAMRDYEPVQVTAMTIDIPTSKTTGGGKKMKLEPIVITRFSPRSSQLLDDFAAFVRNAGTEGDQPLLSFYRRSKKTGRVAHKVVTRREIVTEIKACAIRCGLPPQYFSGNSLRKGNATQSSLGLLSAEERNRAGGWAQGSTVPDEHYDHAARYHGALDAANNLGARQLNSGIVRAMLPNLRSALNPSC
jgi:hypothetical protein